MQQVNMKLHQACPIKTSLIGVHSFLFFSGENAMCKYKFVGVLIDEYLWIR
jgi:hypothetical protein